MKVIVSFGFVCGVCSGIPACCIQFFLTRSDKDKHDGSGNNPKAKALFGPDSLGYIVCPACLKRKHVVEIKDCWTADGKEPLWLNDPSYPCPQRRGGPLPNWSGEYERLLQSVSEPYEGGSPLKKGWMIIEKTINPSYLDRKEV